MPISRKTKNILWAKSGNLCAFCRCKLVIKPEISNDNSIIGEECHIISKKENGPRNKFKTDGMDYDSYDNLLLLCRNHHKLIDDQPENFSVNYLKELKENHEIWVSTTLENGAVKFKKETPSGEIQDFLPRIINGKQLFNTVKNVYGYEYNYPEFENQDDAQIIGDFLQNIQDYGEMSADFEIAEICKAEIELKKILEELEKDGYWLFGKQIKKQMCFSDKSIEIWNIAALSVVKTNDPIILKIDFNQI